jgi:hypothetical protein
VSNAWIFGDITQLERTQGLHVANEEVARNGSIKLREDADKFYEGIVSFIWLTLIVMHIKNMNENLIS